MNQAKTARATAQGFSQKTVLGDSGKLQIDVQRDRQRSFEPLLVPKWHKQLPGFNEQIIALYVRGMTVRDIESMLQKQYRIEVSPDCISSVTDAVHAEVTEWPMAADISVDELKYLPHAWNWSELKWWEPK